MKSIDGYEGIYSVTADGKVFSHRRNKFLSQSNSGRDRNYRSVVLSVGGKKRTIQVHRLVAQTYLEQPTSMHQVNHIDGDGSNNHVNNLEWVTASQNIKHSFDMLGRKSPRPMAGKFGVSHNRSRAFSIESPDGKVFSFEGGLDFLRKTGKDHSSISWALKNKPLPYSFKRKGPLQGWTILP